MKHWNVSYQTTASTIVAVEAADEQEAQDKADGIFQAPTLCASCSGWGPRDETNSGIELADWEPSDNGVWEA